MEKINVLIVDDNARTASMLEEIVQGDEEMTVIGKAENGLDALEMNDKGQGTRCSSS